LLAPLDQVAEVGERGDDHEDGLQVTLLVQLAQRLRAERGEFLLADGVETGEPVLRAIAELDVQREGLEQFVFDQRGHEWIGGGQALVEVASIELMRSRNWLLPPCSRNTARPRCG
jgi:hypothetical protein